MGLADYTVSILANLSTMVEVLVKFVTYNTVLCPGLLEYDDYFITTTGTGALEIESIVIDITLHRVISSLLVHSGRNYFGSVRLF